ncbi:MAG: peptidoglycan recognition family protein [Candidatus Saccharimonadales bacterium]
MAVYDKEGHEYNSDVRDGLSAREKIAENKADWKETKKLGKGYTKSDELRDAEATRDAVTKDFEAGKKGKGEGDDGNSFWTDTRNHKKRKGFWNRKRAAAAGGAASASILAILGLGGIATGPFQLIHLGQILGGNFAGQEDAASQRMQGLFRYIRSGNVGETRLTYIQSKMNARMQATLEKNGITIRTASVSGQVTTISIDTAKNPQYSGLSKENAIKAIAADNGLDVSKISQIENGKFAFNMSDATISQKRSVIKAAVKSQGLGRIAAAQQVRILAKYYNAPSMFHPFKKLAAKGDAAIAKAIDDWKKKRTEKVKATSPEAKARLSKAKTAFGITGGSILAVQGAVCVVREIASDINQINYENVVKPAQQIAVDAIAMGNQTQVGEDMDARLAGAVVEGFYDQKTDTTVSQSKPLRAEQGLRGGIEVDPEVKAAHSSNGTAASIVDFIDSTLAGEYACSDVALVAGTVAGLALIPLTGGGSALATNALKAGTAAVALAAITTIVPKLLADEVVPQDLAGAVGGNLAAYGARSAANSAFIPSAGVALSDSQSAQLEAQQRQEDLEEFQSKSFASRMFDLKDHRSLIAQVMQTQSPNPAQNLTNIAHSFLNTGNSSVASLKNALAPHAYAYDVVAYDYGFPRYGFSQEDLDNPNTQDPYDNADKAAQLLNSTPSYITDAKTCFGVDITKGTHGWQIVPVKDINVTSAEYTSANCAKPGDLNWLRIRMFIFDSRTMNAYACYEGDQEACALENPNAATPPQTTQSSAGSSGYGATAEQLEGLPESCKNGTASGSERMLCVGAKYRNVVPYLYGGNPRNGKQFSELWNGNKRDGLAVDCSLFASVALWDAYGTDATSDTSNFASLTNLFDKIPLADAKPGDLAVDPGAHMGIVNVPGQSVLDANTTHPNSPIDDVNIHPYSYSNYKYALRYKGPNAEGSSVKVGGGGSTAEQNGQGIQIEGVDDLIKENQFPSSTQIIPKVTNVVIHWLVSNPESPSEAGAAFNGTSVQFYVSQSGKIMQLTEFANTRAGHAKDSNAYAIGIEIGSPNGAGDSPPYNSIQNALLSNSNQKNQVIKLTTAIAKKFGIKNITVGNQTLYTKGCTNGFANVLCATQQEASAFGVVGHYQLQNDKYDPGKQYITEIQQAVKANLGL